ncbi:uncharacterized protein LAESUDRAFT_722362 [Laetiporus sulphureus 93-53]|uniref:Uncharacterized protein n=1 Tax=Laetiporus sulphureus 93-53 TaxID=1314785 RepID=A0A165GD93_9APHY|nr:uncharacterized protein LAESUDRAFT_722362 [Laetiporus sulphureus 93-53]KZT10187.1 hypothetical protein LAESUDRAFT_722362 [Laetiporus sulphureus 93-53]
MAQRALSSIVPFLFLRQSSPVHTLFLASIYISSQPWTPQTRRRCASKSHAQSPSLRPNSMLKLVSDIMEESEAGRKARLS